MSKHSDITFSLIMATYNRKREVESFIRSLISQTFDSSRIELIIVDQNKENFLAEIIKEYKGQINIIHIRTDIIGSSVSRNVGIENARGEIIAFPDDDCEYYPDTLTSVYNLFSSNKDIDTALGKVFDRTHQTHIIRKWPNREIYIKENNFFFLYTCISVFTKNKEAIFDPNLGPNTSFGAYEDADYVLSLVKPKTNKILYSPVVQVNHPKLDIDTMNATKLISYGMGFGAFCRKNLSPYVLSLFLGVLIHHLMKLLLATITLNKHAVKKRYLSIVSRTEGFFRYKKSLTNINA